MNKSQEYFAFISYKREDEEWAIWLQHELEYYHLPALLNGREDLPKVFRPVFRDIDELKAGNLPHQIHEALASSTNLIVICSPRSAISEWVNKEINDFIEIGKVKGINNLERVFPFIVDGTPHAKDESQECFPKALRDLPADKERIGGNVNESGRDKAFIKVMAGMLPNVSMDILWNRYERDKAEEERKKREEKDRLLIMQSRLIAKEASNLVKSQLNGRPIDPSLAIRLLIEALPINLEEPNRPYTLDAEKALRGASFYFDSDLIATLAGHSSRINCVAFSPDGKRIVSASCDNTVRTWDIKTKQVSLIMKEHTGNVLSVAFSPQGDRIVSASCDGIMIIWDAETGQPILRIKGHSDSVTSVAFSPDGETLVSASIDKTVRTWNSKTGQQLHIMEGHTSGVNCVSFSQDGKKVLSASKDKTIRLWNVETNELITTLEGHTETVHSVYYSPDGKRLVSASFDDTVRIWDIESKQVIRILEGNFNATFSPDSKQILSLVGGGLKIWNAESGVPIKNFKTNSFYYIGFTISPDGNLLCVWDDNDNNIRLLNAKHEQVNQVLEGHTDIVKSAVFSFDGKHILSASDDKTIRIWNTKGTPVALTLEGHTDKVNSAVFSADGKLIASASDDCSIRIWGSKSGQLIHILNGHSSEVRFASFSPDGKTIASASNDKTVKLWNVQNGLLLQTLEGHTDSITSVTFSPNGKYVLSASWDFYIKLWDAQTGQLLQTMKDNNVVTYVAFSPNGDYYLTGHSSNVKIWDTGLRQVIHTIDGLETFVNSAEFSPDGKYIVTTSGHTINVWNAKTYEEILHLELFLPIYTASFSPDSKQIVLSCYNTIHIWPFPPLQDLIDETRECFKGHPLTPKERQLYYLE